MKKLLLILMVVTLAITGVFSSSASAHVLVQDNGITGVLHIPPDDNPVAAQPSILSIAFSNQRGSFNISDCDCRVHIMRNGKTIQTVDMESASQDDNQDAIADVNFPTIGVYDVLVSGTSRSKSFSSFNLHYTERVATSRGTTTNSATGTNILLISGASFIILIMIAYAAILNGGRYGSKTHK